MNIYLRCGASVVVELELIRIHHAPHLIEFVRLSNIGEQARSTRFFGACPFARTRTVTAG